MLYHPNIPNTARVFLAALSEHPAITSMVLFGSRAYGDHDDRSDVDIAICGPGITRGEWAKIKDAAYHARSLYWITVVHFDSNPGKLQERIIQTGIEIYVQKKAAR
jgi:predicted nucleotidyltransferase